ncbi:MAG: hypothetical protein RLY20_1951 [Verrucomicrobiota bacterium]|jgi:hypothetical protein
MEDQTENFEQLKKLLALKKHEQPPPGYFNKFSGNVISRIHAERAVEHDPMRQLESEAPWLMRFWRALETKPIFGAAFGTAICAVVLGGILMAEKPAKPTARMALPEQSAPETGIAVVSGNQAGSIGQGVLPASANEPGAINLFNMAQSNSQTAPVSFQPRP